MVVEDGGTGRGRQGFLARLARDKRGNTMAMMAAAMIPMAGLAGSAIDMARLYVVKVRLQQACDAGALAGRRLMPDTNDPALDANTVAQATTFFRNNFLSGWMETADTVFTPTRSADAQVEATASTVVPMTIMRMFGSPSRTLTVSCRAEFNVPDTDVMFVLDITGSMACLPSDTTQQCNTYVNNNPAVTYLRPNDNGQPGYASTPGYPGSAGRRVPEATTPTQSRIADLRAAVQTFYTTLQNESDPLTRIRYGFVPYASSVNPGAAILNVAPAMLRGTGASGTPTADYQSRQLTGEYETGRSFRDLPLTQAQCTTTTPVRTPAATPPAAGSFTTAQTATSVWRQWFAANGPTPAGCREVTRQLGPRWTHRPMTWNVAGLVGGGAVADPTKLTGATATWTGCIEERQTARRTMTYNWQALPPDLDPNLAPAGPAQLWVPYWPEVVYYRDLAWNGTEFGPTLFDGDDGRANANQIGDIFTPLNHPNFQNGGFVTCSKPVQRLAQLTAGQIAAYVNAPDFVPHGGTYHDVGMIWGVRMLSPLGPFRADTAPWPGRNDPNRVLVFLTDGDMSPSLTSYTFQGVEHLDNRVSGTDWDNLTNYHNARFLAVCDWARNNRIDVWTVSITTAATPNAQLRGCANTPAQAFATGGVPGGLQTIFRRIAQQVAALRVAQ